MLNIYNNFFLTRDIEAMKNTPFNQYAFLKNLILFNITIEMDTNIPEL